MKVPPILTPAVIGILLLLAGCATTPEAETPEADGGDSTKTEESGAPGPNDPFEGFNRAVYRFNDAFDRALLKPAAELYQAAVPGPVDTGVTNFFGNLGDIRTLVNDLLQLKFEQAASDAGRIAFNTTVGLGGFIDVASHMDFPKHDEDFGQTLGYWGVGSGPYLVLPFLGPSSVRDGIGRIPDGYMHPVYYLEDETAMWSVIALESVDTRAGLLRASRVLEAAALDPYAFMRDSYLQRRRSLVHDGNPPATGSDPFLDDSFLDEDSGDAFLDDSFLDEDSGDEFPDDSFLDEGPDSSADDSPSEQ